jgi:outer membrane protein OmpA-like peptidoglycan-associated protein
MRSDRTPGALLVALAMAIAVAVPGTSAASGSSLDGSRGLLRVHSADPHATGYLAGTVFGSYARVVYQPYESPRARAETIKISETAVAVAYSPATFVELALHGTAESHFLRSAAADVSESAFGLRDLGLGVKTLLTPASRRDFRLSAGLDVTTPTGSTNALAGTWDRDGFDITGRLALTYAYAPVAERTALRAHLNTGWLSRTGGFDDAAWSVTSAGPTPSAAVLHGDQFLYGAGLEVPVKHGATLFAEFSGEYDVDADAPFGDNPMRVTPGVRWSAPGGAFVVTSGVDVSLASEEAGPGWGILAGVSFGSHLEKVSGMLLGVVRDAETGQPVANARVVPRNGGAETVTDADGRFQASLGEGYAVLEISADGYTPKTRVVEVPAHRQVEFDFTLPKRNVYGSVRGHLNDARTGEPVAGRVRVRGATEWVECDPATGAWEIGKVAEGDVVLEFESSRHRAATAETRVVAGDAVVRDAVLEPDPTATFAVVTGEVTDAASGQPVAAVVTARGKTTTSVNADPATGRYELRLEPGAYALSAAGPGHAARGDSLRVAERDSRRMDWSLSGVPSQLMLHGVQFDSGTATIKRESFAALGEAAKFLVDNPTLAVVIEGYLDEGADPASAVALSQRRADAVLKYLVVSFGVDPSRLSAEGRGSADPVAPNDTEENRAKNRRIQLVVRGADAR